jgi:Holliday junction DNA helicase RuvA
MIARLIGRLVEVTDKAALLDVGGVVYEVLLPAYLVPRLRAALEGGSRDVTLHTLHYIEGGVSGSAMIPRVIGFLERSDRDFFTVFTTVKGVGTRKALRAMIEEPAELASHIESNNRAALSRLPEVGARTAEKIIAELRGKLGRFALEARAAVEPDFKLDAVRIFIETLQFTRAEAEGLIERALERNPRIGTADELIQRALNPEPTS